MSFPSYMQPPRLCQLKKWSTYAGYGFNLHAEKGKAGQYIGKVDPDSPAELGGLKTKDYLIEVNGTNVENLTHQMVVEKVKEVSDMVRMLVVEMDSYKHCKENGIVISSDMPEVVAYYTPDTQPTAMGVDTHQEVRREAVPVMQQQPQREAASAPPQQPYSSGISSSNGSGSSNNKSNNNNGSSNNNNNSNAGSDPVANLSLEEMRARIGNNRRNQVKMNPSSFSEKYNMFQAL